MNSKEITTTNCHCDVMHSVKSDRPEVSALRFPDGTIRPFCEFLDHDDCAILRNETNGRCRLITNAPEREKPTKEEWEKFREEMQAAALHLHNKSTETLGPRTGLFWKHKKICELDRQLKLTTLERQKVLAWHVMCGSTIRYEDAPILDFPDPFSVEKSLQALLRELEDAEKCASYMGVPQRPEGSA
jgi:hypothetical protein